MAHETHNNKFKPIGSALLQVIPRGSWCKCVPLWIARLQFRNLVSTCLPREKLGDEIAAPASHPCHLRIAASTERQLNYPVTFSSYRTTVRQWSQPSPPVAELSAIAWLLTRNPGELVMIAPASGNDCDRRSEIVLKAIPIRLPGADSG